MGLGPSCGRCGAISSGPVCSYCGTLLWPAPDADAERAALNALHAQVADRPPAERGELLRHAFLPDDRTVLVEAGRRCLELMYVGRLGALVCADGVPQRLEAIVSKLRILEPDASTRAAIATFEEGLSGFHRDRRPQRYFLTIVVLGGYALKLELINRWNRASGAARVVLGVTGLALVLALARWALRRATLP